MNDQNSDHPWVIAAKHGGPAPLPASVSFEEMTVTQEDGTQHDCAMQTVITPAGVFNFFYPKQMFAEMILKAAQLIQSWEQQEATKFRVASPQDMKEVIDLSEIAKQFRRK